MRGLNSILNPKSVAVIGAAREPGKIGNVIVKNFLDSGFRGEVYPVNPNATEVYGLKCYKSVLDIRGKVDSAVIAIPAKLVPQALEECGKKKVNGVVVISGGFAEVGNEALEQQIAGIAKKYGMAMIGPNCLGVVNPSSKVDSIFLPTYKMGRPKVGGVAFIMQSGAVGSTILDLIAREGFGISKFISYGNAASVDETDLLEYLGADRQTRIIVLYIEGVRRGKEFFKVTRRLAKLKPIVAIKAGTTEGGAKAAKSHTGSLAGNYAAYRAVFRQNRVIEAKTLDEVFDLAKVFETQPHCTGKRIAIITNGGGMGVLATDAVVENGLELAEFGEAALARLRQVMPTTVNARNPLDLTGDADAARYETAINLAYDDPNVDALIVITLFQTVSLDSRVVDVVVKIAGRKEKPLVTVALGGEYTEMQRRALESSGVPSYASPTAAAKSLAKLIEYSRFTEKAGGAGKEAPSEPLPRTPAFRMKGARSAPAAQG